MHSTTTAVKKKITEKPRHISVSSSVEMVTRISPRISGVPPRFTVTGAPETNRRSEKMPRLVMAE